MSVWTHATIMLALIALMIGSISIGKKLDKILSHQESFHKIFVNEDRWQAGVKWDE